MSRTNVETILKRLAKGKGLRPDEYMSLRRHLDESVGLIRQLKGYTEQLMNDGCCCSPKCLPACQQQRPPATQSADRPIAKHHAYRIPAALAPTGGRYVIDVAGVWAHPFKDVPMRERLFVGKYLRNPTAKRKPAAKKKRSARK